MKVLLDENIPHDLRHFLADHEAVTTAHQGWRGVENGELLARAAAQGFEVVITMDAGIQYEQALASLPVAVVLLRAESNALDDQRPLVPRVLRELDTLQPKTLRRVASSRSPATAARGP